MTDSEIDFEELNRHLGLDSGEKQEENKEDSGKQDKRVNLSLTPEQLNEFIKAQKAKETPLQDTQQSSSQETQQNTQQEPEQKTQQEPEQKPQKQYQRKMTDKRREAIKKAQENSPNHKRKKEKEAEAQAKKGQSSLQYQQPVPHPNYIQQSQGQQVPTQQPPVNPYQPHHQNFQQPVNAQVQSYPPIGSYDPNFSVQLPPAEQMPQQPVQPQINYLDQQAMTGYPEPEYYQPSPQPVQDYNSLEYLRNTTTVPSYNYQQQIPRLTRLNPYSARASENDVISSLGFKQETSKPKGIAKPRPNTSAGRPGGVREEPVQNQGLDPLSFFK
jgi:hypothetical protein